MALCGQVSEQAQTFTRVAVRARLCVLRDRTPPHVRHDGIDS